MVSSYLFPRLYHRLHCMRCSLKAGSDNSTVCGVFLLAIFGVSLFVGEFRQVKLSLLLS